MTVAPCAACGRTRETARGLCCDCLAAETSLSAALLHPRDCDITCRLGELAPLALEGFCYTAAPRAAPTAAVYRLHLTAPDSDFTLGARLLPAAGLNILDASVHFVQHIDGAAPLLAPGALNHHVIVTLLDDLATMPAYQAGAPPACVGEVAAALGVDPGLLAAAHLRAPRDPNKEEG